MISVVIPIYNSADKGLDRCLEAVAHQTYSDLQIILVDDGSTDDSAEICERWCSSDARFELIRQENRGPAVARNNGLKEAKGAEIAFVDSDDLPDVRMLEVLHEAITHHDSDMAMARYKASIDANLPYSGVSCVKGKDLLWGLFDYNTPIFKALYAKLFTRRTLEDNCFKDLRSGEDIDFLSQVYERVGVCSIVDCILYQYNDWEDSIMHTQKASDYLDMLCCYENIVQRLAEGDHLLYGRALDALMRKIVSSRYRNRSQKDSMLENRVQELTARYLPSYYSCQNGNIWVKWAIIASIKLPWLHALIMNLRER